MRMTFEEVSTLPRLAWCVRVGRDGVTVRHGPWVEVGDDHFIEGVWDGPFASHRFDKAVTLFGSGGRLTRDGLLVATPTHPLSRLYLIERAGVVFVSNSLAFVLAQADDALDETHIGFVWDLLQFLGSVEHPSAVLPTGRGDHVRLYRHCNILIGNDLSITRQAKAPPDAPQNFEQYHDLLLRSVRAVADNANDPARKQRYRALATISSAAS